MKKKALNKKLSLNKVTVSNLNKEEMQKFNGGEVHTRQRDCMPETEPGPSDNPPPHSRGIGFSCIWPSCIG